jgi:hypothetical protein
LKRSLSAPSQLLNKTVHYSFKASAPTKTSDGRTVTVNGVHYTALDKPTYSEQSCAVSEGNAFAN